MGSRDEVEGLSILNPSPRRLPGPTLLHELVQTDRQNDGPAIDFLSPTGKRVCLSYSELHTSSDALTARISRALTTLPAGVLKDQLVIPLMIPQSPELYVATLAILKAGGAFCPLSIDAPPDRIRFILRDINAPLVLVSSSLMTRVSANDGNIKILAVDEVNETSIGVIEEDVLVSTRQSTENDLAYVMYTSGSTGAPKGVGISHLAATQSLLAHEKHIPSFSRFLQFAAPTFDVSVFEIFFPLKRGSTLVCCHRADMLTDLPGTLQRMDVDACELTPSVAGSLLKNRVDAPNLRLLLTIGEMLTEPVVHEFGGDSVQDSMLWGMYGPTEASIHCTLQPAFHKNETIKCIGFPLDTVSVFVIRNSQDSAEPQPFSILPIGEVGELAIGGHQLATGYINRPEQTTKAFIDTVYGRVYRTGDKARMRSDGTVECLGRVVEGQVKLNGQRMELGEVQHAILRTKGCHGAFACVLNSILVAFVAVDDVDGMKERIMTSCKAWLPAYMVPAEVIVMRSFPLLPSGKIDRIRLQHDYANSQLDGTVEEIDDMDDLQHLLCKTAGHILHSDMSLSTKLASSGLDSLAAIAFASRLRDKGLPISAVDVLEAKTIRHLYRFLQERRNRVDFSDHCNGNHTPSSPNPPTDILKNLQHDAVYSDKVDEIEFIMTPTLLQTSMIVESLKDSRLYKNVVLLDFPLGTDPVLVRSWFLEIAQRNEILRTGFIHLHDSLVEVVWKGLLDEQLTIVDDFAKNKLTSAEQFLERPFRVEILDENKSQQRQAKITIHHAIYDGWTMDLILEDLSLLAKGQQIPERPQFRTICSDHYTPVLECDQARAKEFWAEHLRDSVPPSLPNFKTTAITCSDIPTTSCMIPVNPKEVQRLSQVSNFSTQAIFQAVLAWLWGAVTGNKDVMIGTVFSGRTALIPGIEKVMGPCMNTLPIRVNLEDSSVISELIQSLHSINRQILKVPALTLPDIKKAAGLPIGCKLFDVLFVYQESLASRSRDSNQVKEAWHKDAIETKLLIEVEPRSNGFACQWTWHSDAFPESLIDSLSKQFSHLVKFFSQHDDQPISVVEKSIPQSSLSVYTSGYKPIQTLSSLAAVVENTVEQWPDSTALFFAHSTDSSFLNAEYLTYSQLNATANQVGRYLMSRGASPGGIVAIIMEKSPLLYCGILGILKVGCAYLPILPSTPIKRIQLVLEQAQPHLCLVHNVTEWQSRCVGACEVVGLDEKEILQHPRSNLQVTHDPSQLAYIIYTSGTTGTPKGISVTNKNMLSNIDVLSRIYPHGPGSRMLQACSQAFDVSVFEIFFAWANGMCLCAATNDTLFQDLEQSIRQLKVTHLSMTVTVASLVNPSNVPNVTFLVTSGEPMTDEVLDKWEEHLWQGYGPSETTNICTARKVSRGDSSQYLGWSFENTTSFVLSPDSDHLVPFGCIGEFCFGGEQVAAGYLNMPELTAAKFFEHRKYGRLYRSGDLGRMLPDGSLIILGRLDTQVKLRGQRIELQEIQSLVLGSGMAKSCTVVLLDRLGNKSQQLALFYVPLSQEMQTFSFLPLTPPQQQMNFQILQVLQASLPSYMIPTFFFAISCLPLTSSGKINMDHLRRSVESLSNEVLNQCSLITDATDDSAEWTETEIRIAQTLAETLNIDETLVTRWGSFFALGLTSISGMTLARKLELRFHKRIPLSQILRNHSVGRLAISVDMPDSPSPTTQESLLLPTELAEIVRQQLTKHDVVVERVLPCTPLQEAMLAASESSIDEPSYSNQALFRLRKRPGDMMGYWDEMCQRHGILRTCFVTTESADYPLVQVVLKTKALSWNQLSTSDLDRCTSDHLRTLPAPIDSIKPPHSLAIIHTDNGDDYLSFVCHHALYDGVAMSILLSEIEDLARGIPLMPPPSFDPFLQEARSLPHDTDEFWKSHLDGFKPLDFPQDTTDSTNGSHPLASQTMGKASLSLSAIESRLRELGVPLLAVCQTAWAATLSAVLRRSDICFGNVLSGRSISLDNVDKLVAPCFNTIPFRVNLPESASNRDVVKICQNIHAKTLQYQFTPLRKIQSLLSLNDTHLFSTLLLLQPAARPFDETIWSLEQERGTMHVPIVCEIIPSGQHDSLTSIIHRNTTLFTHSTAQLLQNVFLHAIDACLRHPSSQIDQITKLPTVGQLQLSMQSVKSTTPALKSSSSQPTVVDNETWNELEARIRNVVAKLSHRPEAKIGRHTSIYRLGLDSISAVQVSYLLRQEGLRIPPAEVLQNFTCAGIAAKIQVDGPNPNMEQPSYDFDAFRNAVQRKITDVNLLSEPETILPCTPLQQGMISQFILSEGTSYLNFVEWTVESTQDVLKIAGAWKMMFSRHQILRTGFVSVSHPDTSFAMVVYREKQLEPPVEHLSGRRADSFNPNEWRQQLRRQILGQISLPPWHVVLVEQSGSIKMHMAIHHALYDAFSLQQLLGEIIATLDGKSLGPVVSIESPVSSVFHQIDKKKDDAESFWKRQGHRIVVNSFPVMTPLRISNGQVLHRYRNCGVPCQVFKSKAAKAGVTVQAALQSAWTRVLSSYHGESSVTFGIVLSGRTADSGDEALFPRITTLPAVAENSDSNRELLQSMAEYTASLRRYENTPLSQIQKWVGQVDAPLFDTIVIYQPSEQFDTNPQPWTISDEIATVDYPISLEIEEMPSSHFRLNLVFRDDVLPLEQGDLLLTQFEAILIHLLEFPDGCANDLADLPPDILSLLPAEQNELPSDVTLLHQFLEQSALECPDDLALEFVHGLGEETQSDGWTYRELNDNGNRVANVLVNHGVHPGSIVALSFDKCPEAYLAILGILKAGCAFLALDPTAPVSRREFTLSDSGAVMLLIKAHESSGLGFTGPIQVLEIDMEGLESYSTASPKLQRPISSMDTAYCLYTSGTTGTPKGCLITHENTVQAMLAFQHLFAGRWDKESRCLQFASFHFDVSVLEQYWSWSVGITLVSAPRDLILSDLSSTISRLEITHIDLTPSLGRLVHPDEVPSLCKGVFISGGEPLRQDILDTWGPKGVVFNAYGPTEATIGVTMYCRVPQNGKSSNIGKQFPNVGMYVLCPGSDVPVLRGGVGELCISGKLVGKGYLNRSELTEKRFPTLAKYGERVYRTGDLVRVLYDGCFDSLGRADDQVKLRGQRLEIGEINSTIRTGVSQILDVATLVAKHGNQDRDTLVSFIVTTSSKDHGQDLCIISDSENLNVCGQAQGACRDRLPGYMVPTYVFCVPLIPLSANNKAQTNMLRKLLADTPPDQLRNLSSAATNGSAPLNATEPRLARVLAEVTKIDIGKIFSSSTIYHLGIDSISVIEVARRLRAHGFPHASPSTILRHSYLGALARRLREASIKTDNSQVLRVKQGILACHHRHLRSICHVFGVSQATVEYIAPCTPLQEGMLSRSATSGERSIYFNMFRFELAPDVSVERLRDAWQHVVDSCAVLRTCFLQTSEGYVQVAFKKSLLKWQGLEIDDDTLSTCVFERYKGWVRRNQSTFSYPFEIDCLRHDGKRTLVIRIFHGIYDARSFDLMVQQVLAVYKNVKPVIGPPFIDVLPHGPLCTYAETRPFWQELYEDFKFHPMPSLVSEIGTSDAISTATCDIGATEARRMSLGVTQQTIVQAAWLSVLRQHFPTWPTIGVVLSGRSLLLDGIENTVGPLFNTLPFRVKESAVSSLSALIQDTHQFNASVISFAYTPLRQIQKWCSNGQTMFDTLFTFDREHLSVVNEQRDLWTEVAAEAQSDYPLAFEAILKGKNKLIVTLVAQPHIADVVALEGMLDEFQRVLLEIAADEELLGPSRDVSDQTDASVSSSAGSNPTPSSSSSEAQSMFEWTDQARSIQAEMAALAGVSASQVQEHTTLLELGLDSIDFVKLVSRLRRVGVNLTTTELKKRGTIEGILESLHRHVSTDDASSSDLIQLESEIFHLEEYLKSTVHELDNIEAVLPPTPLQDSMVTEMILSDFQRYFNHDLLEIHSETNLENLRSAIETVVQNSPILRTTFVEVEDPGLKMTYCQVITKHVDVFQSAASLDSLGQTDKLMEDVRRRASAAKGASQLLQFTPVEIKGQHYLVLSISHALYDGASLDLFHRDVQAAYHGCYVPRKPYKPILAAIVAGSSDTAGRFWSNFLHGANKTLLPQKDDDTHDTEVRRMEFFSIVDLSDIKSFCKQHRITAQVLGQACWAAVLASLTQSLDVTFGVVLSGRETEESQGLLLPTMNTVPIRVILHGTASDYLQYIWENLSNISEFQHFPLRKAQKLAGPDIHGPLFNTLFTMQSHMENNAVGRENETSIWKSVRSVSEVEYPVCVEMEVAGDRLMWRVACDPHYIDQKDAGKLLSQLDEVLGFLITSDKNTEVMDFQSNTAFVSVCGLSPFALSDYGLDEVKSKNTIDTVSGDYDVDFWSDETVAAIVDVLADLSGVERSTITPDQNIYHLGLDSISAIKASSMLRRRGVFVSVKTMARPASMRVIATEAKQKQSRALESQDAVQSLHLSKNLDMPALITSMGLEPDAVERILPALPMQVHMLSAWANSDGQLFFHEFSYQMLGQVSKAQIIQAWNTLVLEIPILRTRFAATGSTDIPFIQVVASSGSAQATADNSTGEGNSDSWELEATGSPFVLLRATKTTTDSIELKLKMHHALYDGVSLPIIMNRFRDVCNDKMISSPFNYSLWNDLVSKHYIQDIRKTRRSFWTKHLEGHITTANLGNEDESNSSQLTSRVAEFKKGVLGDVSTLKAAASARGIGIQSIFFAAYARVLSTNHQSSDIVFGVYLANRAAFVETLQSVPCPTLSIVPLRVHVGSLDESVIDIARRVQDDLGQISTWENASVGLWEVEAWTGVKMDSFVNFLSLPADFDASSAANELVALKETTGLAPSSQDSPVRLEGMATPRDGWLARSQVGGIYMDSVDVEVALRDDGLDIGVFCPARLLSRGQVLGLIDSIVQILEQVEK